MDVITGQPPLSPHACSVLPHTSVNADPEMRFVDTGMTIDSPLPTQLYVSEAAVTEMGRLLGHPLPEEYRDALEDLARLHAELEDVRSQLQIADKELDSIAELRGRGYQQVKRKGRPPQKKETTTAKAA